MEASHVLRTLARWKWAIALRLSAKVFLINENGDYFWLDRGHLDLLRQIVLLRSGLAGERPPFTLFCSATTT